MRNKTMLAILLSILVFCLVACGGQTVVEAPPAEDSAEQASTEESPAEEPPTEAAPTEEPPTVAAPTEEPAEEIALRPAINCVAHPELKLPERIPPGKIKSTENHARIFWTVYAAGYGRESARDRLMNEYGVDSIEALVTNPLSEHDITTIGQLQEGVESVDNLLAAAEGAGLTVEQFLADYYGLGSFDSLIEELTNELVWKEVSVYDIAEGSAQEVLCDEFDLQVNLMCPVPGDAAMDDAARRELFWLRVGWLDNVLRTNEIILDNGCYLQIEDVGLSAQADDMSIMLEERLEASEAVAARAKAVLTTSADNSDQFVGGFYVGENIWLEVFYSATGDGVHPLFDHPQYYEANLDGAKGAVSVFEAVGVGGDKNRSAVWQVGADDSNAPYFDKSEPYELAGRLLARQGQVIPADGEAYNLIKSNSKTTCQSEPDPQPYFEFRVDDDAQPEPRCDNSTHYFWTGAETFYIGFSPTVNDVIMLDLPGVNPASEIPAQDTLRGIVKDLVFDPNASCVYC